MRVIGLAGWSGAGKTHLLVRLIPVLRARGLSVSTLKHAHHVFDVDRPGKDSFEHRAAGAQEVLVASSKRWALMHELRDEPEPELAQLLPKLSAVDVAIVEGFKKSAHVKIEVFRGSNGKPLLHIEDRNIVALASDLTPPPLHIPHASLDDTNAIADLVLTHALPLEQTLARLAVQHGAA